ncbi:MAG TPA: glutamine--fructose-6-phosphate transaminase (isomerizing) [Solirubrobacteraceae bacterium]|nr:glutamine--fructose-6-phosphate transaminase (isomerizing) [Solirubrobacteraceae bacterium]
MCGIVGYVGERAALQLLLAGLEKLEYRGYDSAGISVLADGEIMSIRAVGNLSALRGAIDASGDNGGFTASSKASQDDHATAPTTGIGHTRWATHGRVSEANAHPHYDSDDRVHVVLNGIVENYVELRRELVDRGAEFTSETDAEVVAHLVARHMRAGVATKDGEGALTAAVRAAYAELRGHYAFVALSADEPDTIVGARKECPLIVGRGDGEQFLASAIPAFLKETRNVQYINDDEVVTVSREGVLFRTAAGEPLEREVVEIDWDAETAEKGGYETFMLKEIHEQAEAVAETVADRTSAGDSVALDLGGIGDDLLKAVGRVVIVACGTSYHAGLVGRYAIEEWARVPVEMDIASEYRYRNPVVGPGDLVVGISQSGETADTLAAMRLARDAGAHVLAVTNVMGSQATRDADGVLYTRAGLEIGVAATKTFVAQVAAMYLLGLRLAELRGTLDGKELAELITQIKHLPHDVDETIASAEGPTRAIADEFWEAEFFLYLGRHIGLPIALEGALKLKEISYIATDAYAAGEMKHGPIALLNERTPVICVATDSRVIDKVISNIQEVRARGAHVIAVATEGNEQIAEHAELVITVPNTHWMLQPLLAVIPLQLLAYRIARKRGLNVDQPRNLAKTVTVE